MMLTTTRSNRTVCKRTIRHHVYWRDSLIPKDGSRAQSSFVFPGTCSPSFRSDRSDFTNLPQQVDLLERYRGLVTLGRIQYDANQVRVVMELRRLQKVLRDYAPPALSSGLFHTTPITDASFGTTAISEGPWWSDTSKEAELTSDVTSLVRIKSLSEELASLDTPKGLLLTGSPGSGKSFLVDLWYSSFPSPHKARKHYNQFVIEIYRAVWEETQRRMSVSRAAAIAPEEAAPWNRSLRESWRELSKLSLLPTKWTRRLGPGNSLSGSTPTIAFMVALRLLRRHWLLVFDEVQLLDVSSAGLLADVLSWFWRMGGVVVGTSNKVPDDLYRNGVQRERLEPFVDALKARCPVMALESEHDWRVVRNGDDSNWYTWDESEAFEDKVKSNFSYEPRSQTLHVFGRQIKVPWVSGGACKYTFAQLCEESLGSADYLTLASNYHTIIISSIPTLELSDKNQARRFISLIDALYESRCRIICHAEAKPEALFFSGAGLSVDDGRDILHVESLGETQDRNRPNISTYDSPGMSEAPMSPAPLALDKLSIFSGQDEQFAFKRALSRLMEMSSSVYFSEEKWTPLPPSSRKWESALTGSLLSRPSTSPDSIRDEDSMRDDESSRKDTGNHFNSLLERPEAPRLSEDHIWGVREDWGERAKDWGKGASAFSEPSTSKKGPS
ncbi:hypothetical protein SERLADRAFT_448478 [Serpula lacrymans var. lacrymans S7.9]|nr:uncharacterized protein SERLADRAFT_448478 [Serpula lacrymans var. lacrymans S7.9]EGO25507.1 hypothetical protein SERLADRAFT_448478 [Serpula lacrymans var. lacrymans S7.9]